MRPFQSSGFSAGSPTHQVRGAARDINNKRALNQQPTPEKVAVSPAGGP